MLHPGSRFARLVPLALALGVLPVARDAAGENWANLGGEPPVASHSMIYDPVRDRLVSFGGGKPVMLGSTFTLPLTSPREWSLLTVTGNAAANARYGHTAIYDPLRDRMVVYGGTGGGFGGFATTWALSLAGSPRWNLIVPSPAGGMPPGRMDHSAILDPVRNRMIIFGGASPSAMNDTWALTLAGTPTWGPISAEGAPPPARASHAAIYDPVRDRMIVFGGSNGATDYSDVWALDLSDTPTWRQLQPEGAPPSARIQARAVYDPVRDRMLVFGGASASSRLDELWSLTLSGSPAWTLLAPAGELPPARMAHALVYDPGRDALALYGGDGTESSPLGDAWTLSLANPLSWQRLTPVNPGGRGGATLAWDPLRERMLLWGGRSEASQMGAWALSLAPPYPWSLIQTTGAAPQGGNMCIDAAADRMVVHGVGATGRETHALNIATGMWTDLTPAGDAPRARTSASLVYDPPRRRAILFGGVVPPFFGYLDDVWSFDLAGGAGWTRLSPSGTPPAARSGHIAVYDAVRQRMLVFGGGAQTGAYEGSEASGGEFNDVWALSLSGPPVWSEVVAGGTPPPAGRNHVGAYDTGQDRLLIQGSGYGDPPGDLWALSLAGEPRWTALTPTGAPPPTLRGQAGAFGGACPRFIIATGVVAESTYSSYSPDAWALETSCIPTAVLVSVVSATAERGRVIVEWALGDEPPAKLWVLRSREGEFWATLDEATSDARGHVRHEDSSVEAGRSYGYALFVLDGNGERRLGEVWVTVPVSFPFALEGARPNPASRDWTVSYSLPDGAPAKIELLDITGRSILSRDLGATSPGPHVLGIARGGIAPGVYFIRLTQAGRSLSASMVVVE